MRVLFIDIDSLRPDHLGCYGYHRNTSPNMDGVAAEGVRFTNYYTTDAPCNPSRNALMSGRYGIHTGLVGHGGTSADFRVEGADRGFRQALDRECMPAIFRQAGYYTALVSPFGERHSAYPFYAGFREMHNTGGGGMEEAGEVTPAALSFLDRKGADDDWFLYVNYWDPHTPYRTVPEFGNPFEEDSAPDWVTDEVLEQHNRQVGPHTSLSLGMYGHGDDENLPRTVKEVRTRDDWKRLCDGYDCGVRRADSEIGRIFNRLRELGVFEDTAIIITADHGENLGELGIYAEHGTADHGTCRIPMIIKWPGVKQGFVDEGLHAHLDLLPTLQELLGTEACRRWDGRSYAGSLVEGATTGRDDLVISQCAHVCQRSVRFGPWLYMRTYHDGYHLFPREMLFNVDNDPHEQHDLAAERPDRCHEGAHRLAAWHDEMMATSDSDVDPLWTTLREGGPMHANQPLTAYAEHLVATGREEGLKELKRRHPRAFPNR